MRHDWLTVNGDPARSIRNLQPVCLVGERTREALAVTRDQGVRLGRPPALPQRVRARIHRERKQGRSLSEIARRLNADGVPTAHNGKQWYPSTVKAVLAAQG
jgi:DNA invertase Pin-like site-specific DNA recombinase